jgi:DNA polymerase III delta prime subunit
MMNFNQYLPQRIFLVQGNESVYQKLCDQYASPALHQLAVNRFTIDDARDVATWMIDGTGEERMLLIYTPLFSPDAAQVLLKSFEEPDLLTTVVLVTPYPYAIPLTIRSRVVLISSDQYAQPELAIQKSELLEYAKQEFGKESDEDASSKRAHATAFLDQLELLARNDPQKARAIYEAKHMLFVANMPTKFVVDYAVTAVL